MPWDPAQYLKFADHRLRPAVDLLGRVDLAERRRGVRSGRGRRQCHPAHQGALARGARHRRRLLRRDARQGRRVRARDPTGAGRPRRPGGRRGPADLIYSNAALHWIEGHARLFPALLGGLAPGGVLAVQMPRNFSAPSHTLDRRGGARRPVARPARAAAPALAGGAIPPSTTTCWRRTRPRSTSGRRSISRCSRATTR